MQLNDFKHIFQSGTGDSTLLLLHGTGADEGDLIPLARQLGWTGHILSLRGRVSEQGMPRFFKRLSFGVFDLEDLALRTQELLDYLPVAAAHYGFDRQQLDSLGYSNGANLIGSALLRAPGCFRKSVLLRPMIPFQPEYRPPKPLAKCCCSAAATTRLSLPACPKPTRNYCRLTTRARCVWSCYPVVTG